MKANELYRALEEQFEPNKCTDVFPKIGLQYENTQNIEKVYTATFASSEVFEKLQKIGAKNALLFTHHPVPQRDNILAKPKEIEEKWQKFMEEKGITLFSYHIPLDKNGPYSPGNNLAKAMGIEPFEEFYLQNGVKMGVICNSNMKTTQEVKEKLEKTLGHQVKLYSFGEENLIDGKIAIMAGGAKSTEIYQELKEKSVNLFITGVSTETADWVKEVHQKAQESGINVLGGTHYSTEKFAPMEMVKFFGKLGIEAEFIEETPKLNEL